MNQHRASFPSKRGRKLHEIMVKQRRPAWIHFVADRDKLLIEFNFDDDWFAGNVREKARCEKREDRYRHAMRSQGALARALIKAILMRTALI